MVASGTRLGLLAWDARSVQWAAWLEQDEPHNRFNDGKVDPARRFVAGGCPAGGGACAGPVRGQSPGCPRGTEGRREPCPARPSPRWSPSRVTISVLCRVRCDSGWGGPRGRGTLGSPAPGSLTLPSQVPCRRRRPRECGGQVGARCTLCTPTSPWTDSGTGWRSPMGWTGPPISAPSTMWTAWTSACEPTTTTRTRAPSVGPHPSCVPADVAPAHGHQGPGVSWSLESPGGLREGPGQQDAGPRATRERNGGGDSQQRGQQLRMAASCPTADTRQMRAQGCRQGGGAVLEG